MFKFLNNQNYCFVKKYFAFLSQKSLQTKFIWYVRPLEGCYVTYFCLFILKWTKIGKQFIKKKWWCVPFRQSILPLLPWWPLSGEDLFVFSTCQILSFKILVVKIKETRLSRFVRPLDFRKIIITLKSPAGFQRWNNVIFCQLWKHEII